MLGVKLEFHIEDDFGLFPEGEAVSGRFFALGQDVDVRIPRLPYQIALKLMTLHAPPVGIDNARVNAIPHQLYDLDALLDQLADAEQWNVLADYTLRRYLKEERQRERTPAADGPWASIIRRLSAWSQADVPNLPFGGLIRAFQASQVATAMARPPAQWRGRVRRLQFAVAGLAAGRDGYPRWTRARALEARIAEPAGPKLKAYRAALATVTGEPAKTLGQFPRVPFWEHLATVADPDGALDALDAVLL